MSRKESNVAYIDAANLHKGVENLGWKMNYKRFRVWLKDKYGIQQAYIFIGLVPKNKEVIYDGEGKVKGNCDADLVLKAAQDAYENTFEKAVLVSSDGDYAGLVKFLLAKNKFETILSPAPAEKCSILLKRTGAKISYLSDQKSILQFVK